MGSEIILKKLNQIENLLDDLGEILNNPFSEFRNNKLFVGTAERYFQLLVDAASDINVQILVDKGKGTPDTYRQSFFEVGRENVLPSSLADELAVSAQLRNILVHEYDFEEDYRKFYDEAKRFIPLFRSYCKAIHEYASSSFKRQSF